MKNKLLMSTAIASIALAGSAFAETKVTGNLEQTYRSTSQTGKDSAGGFGAEYNIGLSSSKELDNGLKASYSFNLEDGGVDAHNLTVGTDTVSITVGRDTGKNLSGSAIPHVGDQAGTIVGTTGATLSNQGFSSGTNKDVGLAHNYDHISLNLNGMGGTFTARYAPGSTNGSDTSEVNDADGSITEILYTGNLGVEGLNVVIGQGDEDADAATKEDGKFQKAGIAYNFGQFAVGIERQKVENIATAATQIENQSDKASVVFAVNDNLSLGLQYIETEKKDGGTKAANDEKITMAEIGYNFGGLGIQLQYADIENTGNAANQDEEAFQIRTIQKF